ncbi:MAG: iron ABC transporter permease [Planctomycetota bacterium]|nr:MAG: iron ABC transporter permease [Planctomycetota bacterium]
MSTRVRKAAAGLAVLATAAGAACLARLLVGGPRLGWAESDAILSLRIDRVAVGSAVGAGLAVAGVLLQSLLRNPLAAPDLLGLSAGAGFAVTVTALLSGGMIGVAASAGPALVGAMAVLGLVWLLAQRRGLIDPVTMILVGVIVAVLLGAATMLVRTLLPDQGQGIGRWMMGAISDDAPRWAVGVVWALVLFVGGAAVAMGRMFDASSLGEDEARATGVPVGWVRSLQLIGAGVLTAGTIVLAGPVGFVGLVCPHLARLLVGPAHRVLIMGAALAGIALVVGADAAVKAFPGPGGRVPVGVVTSLIGGPVFLALLLRSRRAAQV